MDINAKIKLIAETMTGYSVVVDTSNGANVELSKITMPCILVFIQETGEFASNNSHYRDSVNIRVAFLNKMPKGFKESDVETMRYELKQDMVILYHKLKFDFQFKINNETVRYEIVYDEFDDNLLGVVFNDNIKERVGLNLACDVPDSHGELPSSPSFCQKVSECSSIVSINEMLDSLQQQIDDLPTTTGVQSVTGPNVDNTDPTNPIIITPTLQQVITENPTVDGVIAQSLNGLADISITDNYVQTNVNDGTNYAQHTVQATNITTTVNGTGSVITDGNIEFATPSLTKNGVEIATENFVDNRVQSNIKIIGDWDASSGSYPLADESNTTPFITQWGATIKAGWAFRVGYGQAGTVDGFDYENGDVVYALVDNPTDNSSDWGDLDHNLQQATESLRGTAKIVSAAIVADETSTDDERIVTTKKLWLNFWTRVLAIAHTFAAKITFTTAPRFSSTTANQRLEVDSNKDLISVAKGTADNANYGSTAGTVAEGNDARIVGAEQSSNKDASGGYVGLTLFKINFKNAANTFTSFFTNTNTASRTYTFPDRNGTIADDTDLALKLTKNNFIDIVSSCVFVGWASYTTKSVRSVDMGDYYIVTGYVVGTSNNATTTIQLPYTNQGHRQVYSGYGVNGASGSIFTRILINGGSDTIDFRTGAAGNAWAITGTKEVSFNLIIEK